MIDTEKARNELKKAFPFTEVCTKYNTKSGKEIAIEIDRSEAFYVWLQKFDTTAGIEGIKIKNEKFPGQPYDRKHTRNSNLNEKNSPKLKLGHH